MSEQKYKGIILAGGSGTRLHPVTQGVSKQLLPIFDKPMVYYPLSVLMLAGIQDILLISTPIDINGYKRLLGDGSEFGINISYEIQEKPEGLAQAFIIGDNFIKNDNVALVLGDNIFYGEHFSDKLKLATKKSKGATIFGYHVENPSQFGVVSYDIHGKVETIEEKPINPRSNYAVTGLYFYDNEVIKIAKSVEPSHRGELEISSINQIYLEKKMLDVEILGRGFAWLDTGTHDSLLEASMFVQTIEKRQGLKLGCLEEIAFNNGWISRDMILEKAKSLYKTGYGTYLKKIIDLNTGEN